MDQLQAERTESFKAGLVGGISTGSVFLLTLLLHRAIAPLPATQATALSVTAAANSTNLLPTTLFTLNGLVSALAAGITGFLFGVTYRYVIRQDQNPQLKSGAVLAFGLTRALAQMELGLALEGTPWAVLLLAAESLVMVAIARILLDWAIAQGWVKPFGTQTVSPTDYTNPADPSNME